MSLAHAKAQFSKERRPIDEKADDHATIEKRSGRSLFAATAPFAVEVESTSWWHVSSTFVLMITALVGAMLIDWWPLRVVLSVVGALIMVRAFITYHDYMHGAILRRSRFASVLFGIYASFTLTPMRSWNASHNFHHGHVGQIEGSDIGAFPVMTTQMWRDASFIERVWYRFQRHPLTVLLGYVTIFFFSVCFMPLVREPIKHWDSAVSLLAHFGLIAMLWIFGGFDMAFFGVLLPMTVASAVGGYLFFAQHSFKHMRILAPESWSFYRAAVESSSYLRVGKVMQWFTGNIGYHHIHHLNVRIPFYRLPETMNAIPELQEPETTSLTPTEILGCFRANLWHEASGCMISYREAAALK